MEFVVVIWVLHAMVAGLPAVVGLFLRGPGNWSGFAVALLILPFAALVGMTMAWPIAGLSSFAMTLALLTVVVFVAEVLLQMPLFGTAWSQFLVLLVAVLAAVPIHLAVPALPD
jgi:hypothetical protein